MAHYRVHFLGPTAGARPDLRTALVQERASHAGKIGNAHLRKVRAEFSSTPTTLIALLHHHLITYTRSSRTPASQEMLIKMRCVRSQASSSTLSACASTS